MQSIRVAYRVLHCRGGDRVDEQKCHGYCLREARHFTMPLIPKIRRHWIDCRNSKQCRVRPIFSRDFQR